jgi:hypothetical protein
VQKQYLQNDLLRRLDQGITVDAVTEKASSKDGFNVLDFEFLKLQLLE